MSLALGAGLVGAAAGWFALHPASQQAARPAAHLTTAPAVSLPGPVDSNSPLVWSLRDDRPELQVFHSAIYTWRAAGPNLNHVGSSERVLYGPAPPAGKWLEAVVEDDDGTLYGWYHNEPPIGDLCPGDTRTRPQIGAARSRDAGATWESLGIVIAPPLAVDCGSANNYFVGGVGDLSVALDGDRRWLYLFFSMYGARHDQQGIGFARMAWADRDLPVGRLKWWTRSAWYEGGTWGWREAAAPTPEFGPRGSWHLAQAPVLGFWGPSVHWNTYLRRYVMLLNRAQDPQFAQEGVYVAFNASLDNPAGWTPPERLLKGGDWYPQVVGLEAGVGTDKVAGKRARLFVGGTSRWFIDFDLHPTEQVAACCGDASDFAGVEPAGADEPHAAVTDQ